MINHLIIHALWLLLKNCSGIHPSKSQLNEWAAKANHDLHKDNKLELINR